MKILPSLSYGTLFFTQDIPEFSFVQDDDDFSLQIRVKVVTGDVVVHDMLLYPQGGSVSLDLSDVIHEYMKNHNLSSCPFFITAEDPEEISSRIETQIMAVFSRTKMYMDATDCLKKNFLISGNCKYIPIGAVDYLSFRPDVGEDLIIGAKIGATDFTELKRIHYDSSSIKTELINFGELTNQAYAEGGALAGTDSVIRAFVARCGSREFYWFIRYDMQLNAAISFKNEFGLPELYYSFGLWKHETNAESESANVSGVKKIYNANVSDTFKIITEPLQYDMSITAFMMAASGSFTAFLLRGSRYFRIDLTVDKVEYVYASIAEEMEQVTVTCSPAYKSEGVVRLVAQPLSRFTEEFNQVFY